MPWKTYCYVIIEADTRPLELFLGLFSFAWGVWMLGEAFSSPVVIPLYRAIETHGGHFVWAGWSLFNGFFQAVCVWLKYPRFRRLSCSSSAIFWIFVVYCLANSDARLFTVYMSGLLAVGELWVVLHRTAID